MMGHIVILWVLLKLSAPWWCYLFLAISFLVRIITVMLKIVDD